MDQPRIEYPCWWTYAIIGPDEEDLRMAVGEIAKGFKHKVAFSKQSAKAKFVSLHVELWVVSEAQRNEVFQAFKSHPEIRMVL